MAAPGGEAGGATADSGLRCPACEYNLTGLTEPRCPECGAGFSWEQLRNAAGAKPSIAFEAERGSGKIRGFIRTWFTVLLRPDVFSRQILNRVDGRHALVFGAICFLATGGGFIFGMEVKTWVVWLTTAAAYIVGQAGLFALADRETWVAGRPGRAWQFWLKAGGYTSAMMATEIVYGPPMYEVEDVFAFLVNPFYPLQSSASRFTPFTPGRTPENLVHWLNVMLWAVALACIFIRRQRLRRGWAWVTGLVLVGGLAAAYAAAVQFLGTALWTAID
jgi:hypothetical protein